MIIFFDWDNKGSSGPQDGQSDHTGIVQKSKTVSFIPLRETPVIAVG